VLRERKRAKQVRKKRTSYVVALAKLKERLNNSFPGEEEAVSDHRIVEAHHRQSK
jgi:hypothetical protein